MKRQIFALSLILLLTAVFQAWFMGVGSGTQDISDSKLCNLYTEALARGQSYLLEAPDARVLKEPDPFNSAAKQYLIYDASLYNGRYYMYFGIVPFVSLLVPWLLATGHYLSPSAAILIFSLIGYIANGILLLRFARRIPATPLPALATALIVVIVAGGTWALMGRPAIYELENAAAYSCISLSLLFIGLVELEFPKPHNCSLLASSFAALAIGCRPNYFPAVFVIGTWALVRSWHEDRGPLRNSFQLLTASSPYFLIGSGLAWWNYHRFGNIFQFGLKYTVSSNPSLTHPLASLRNIPYNAHRYLLGAPRIIDQFPFIQGQKEGPFPLSPFQEPSNQVYGFFLLTPILIYSVFIWPRFNRKPLIEASAYPFVLLLTFAGNIGFMLTVGMGSYRYPTDFLAPLALLAAFGILGISQIAHRKISWIARWALLPLMLWSVCAVVFEVYSIAQTHSLYDQRRAHSFSSAAKPFNFIVYRLEELLGNGPRALSITLKLPEDRFGKSEPLLVTGEAGAQDFLYFYYAGPGSLQLGFESMGHGGPRSSYFPIDYSSRHQVDIYYGSFLPPDSHPLLDRLGPADVALARRMITVCVDGVPVLDDWAEFHLPRGQYFFGESPFDAAFGKSFSGQILAIKKPQLPARASSPRWDHSAYGPLSFTAQIVAQPPGVYDPLVSFGYPTGGAQLLVEHLSSTQVRIVWLDTKKNRLSGAPFTWLPNSPGEFSISTGLLYPPLTSSLWPNYIEPPRRNQLKRETRVVFNGKIVLEADCPSSDVSPTAVAVGRDKLFLVGGVLPVFQGTVGEVTHLSW